jgi:hypothetical protein
MQLLRNFIVSIRFLNHYIFYNFQLTKDISLDVNGHVLILKSSKNSLPTIVCLSLIVNQSPQNFYDDKK